MRLLVVEDEARMARLINRGLEEEGHVVDIAADGPDGLWMAEENSYGAVIVDVMLPGFDGFELCRKLRAAEIWVPVLPAVGQGAGQPEGRGPGGSGRWARSCCGARSSPSPPAP